MTPAHRTLCCARTQVVGRWDRSDEWSARTEFLPEPEETKSLFFEDPVQAYTLKRCATLSRVIPSDLTVSNRIMVYALRPTSPVRSLSRHEMAQRMGMVERVALRQNIGQLPFSNAALAGARRA